MDDNIQPVPPSVQETGDEYEGNQTDDQVMVSISIDDTRQRRWCTDSIIEKPWLYAGKKTTG